MEAGWASPLPQANTLADEALDAAQLRSPYPSDSLNSVQGDPSTFCADSLSQTLRPMWTPSRALLGRGTTGSLQKRLLVLLAIGAVVLALMAGWVLQRADRARSLGSHRAGADAVAATGQVGVAGAGGQSAGFPGCGGKRAGVLGRNVRALNAGDAKLGCKSTGEAFRAIWTPSRR